MDENVKSIQLQRVLSFEVMTYALLFLFPIGGMLFRGWITNIFNLLCLLGLIYLRKRSQPLLKQERVYLIICAVYVGVFLLSGLVNGWKPIQTHDLGTELRFWMAIPIYLLVREQRDSWRWLLFGSLIGIFFIFSQSVYEVYWQGRETAWGVYSKNLIGPFAALSGFWIMSIWKEFNNLFWKSLIVIAFVLAVVATALSGSRGAYVGFIVLFISWLLLHIRMRWVFITALLIPGLALVVYMNFSIVSNGIDRAMIGTKSYLQSSDKVHLKLSYGSTELRLEMWRAAKYFFPDHPILGVGPGNYEATAKKYVQEGKLNPQMAFFSHPHNIFLEALYSKGIIGLISLLLLLYYPLSVVFKTCSQSRSSAALCILHIVGISAFSMTDASPILYNNYASILLLGISVFFSSHLNQIKQSTLANA